MSDNDQPVDTVERQCESRPQENTDSSFTGRSSQTSHIQEEAAHIKKEAVRLLVWLWRVIWDLIEELTTDRDNRRRQDTFQRRMEETQNSDSGSEEEIAVETEERDETFVITADLRGLDAGSAEVYVTSDRLFFEAKTRVHSESQTPKPVFSEIVSLPWEVPEDLVDRQLLHGVLRVSVPMEPVVEEQQDLSNPRETPEEMVSESGEEILDNPGSKWDHRLTIGQTVLAAVVFLLYIASFQIRIPPEWLVLAVGVLGLVVLIRLVRIDWGQSIRF